MRHDVAALFPALLRGLGEGPACIDRFGHTLFTLRPASDEADHASPTAELSTREAVPAEHEPPMPDRIVATNRSDHAVVLPAGIIAAGGLCDRAVLETAVLEAREARTVPVEAIEARWWREGPLHWAGSVEPALMAALMLASRADGGLRAMARTAVWSVATPSREEGAAASIDASLASWRGWVLYRSGLLLAASVRASERPTHLGLPGAAPQQRPPSAPQGETISQMAAVLRLVRWTEDTGTAYLRDGRVIAARRVLWAPGVVEVSMVRLTTDLLEGLVATAG